jgi:hypothetical protein
METREEGIPVAEGILNVSTPTTLGLAHTGRLQHCCPYAPSTGMRQMINSASGFPSNITRSYQLRTCINSVLLGLPLRLVRNSVTAAGAVCVSFVEQSSHLSRISLVLTYMAQVIIIA